MYTLHLGKLLLGCLLLTFAYSCNYGRIDCKQTVEDANNALSIAKTNTDTLAVIKQLEDASSKSTCTDVELMKGGLYGDCYMDNKAKSCYKDVLQLNPQNQMAIYNLGLLYYYCNKYDSSIYYLNQIVDTIDKFAVTLNPELKQLANIDEDNIKYTIPKEEVICHLALDYYYLRQFNDALNYYNLCLKYNYKPKSTYTQLGLIYHEMNEPDKACDNFRMAKSLGSVKADEYLRQYCNGK
jgi:phage terminase small subunit